AALRPRAWPLPSSPGSAWLAGLPPGHGRRPSPRDRLGHGLPLPVPDRDSDRDGSSVPRGGLTGVVNITRWGGWRAPDSGCEDDRTVTFLPPTMRTKREHRRVCQVRAGRAVRPDVRAGPHHRPRGGRWVAVRAG